MKPTETRKLRSDLTPEQREKAERIGSLDYRSPRNADRMSHGAVFHFVPDRTIVEGGQDGDRNAGGR
jgi:hypothetical protein